MDGRNLSEAGYPNPNNRVDIGARIEIPAEVFSHITDKIVKVR